MHLCNNQLSSGDSVSMTSFLLDIMLYCFFSCWRSAITCILLQFKEISFAYEVLSNPDKRETYDRFGLQGLKEGAGGGGKKKLLAYIRQLSIFILLP